MVKIPEQAVKAALDAFLNTARTIDGIKAALTAAAPHMSGVKVKQLEWEPIIRGGKDQQAKCSFGKYVISVDSFQTGLTHYIWVAGQSDDEEHKYECETMAEAKAVAQADFEKRILSAIEPSPAREQPLPSNLIHEYAQGYEWRGDGGDYTPTDAERAMIEDAIVGYAGYFDEVLMDVFRAKQVQKSAREQALEEGYRCGVEDAAKKAAELLVFTDTTSKAIKEIAAAIRALKSQPAPQTGGGE